MPAPLYDAHCHLADERFDPHQHTIHEDLKRINCRVSVVNGTSPADWQAVLDYAEAHTNTLPAIGLHPWQVTSAPSDWQLHFLRALDEGVRMVGEIGLDQWVEDHDIEAQQVAFRWQLGQAAKRNLPVSIHCLRAIGPLMQSLRSTDLPRRGIHLHALNVSVEAARELIELGTYFSFNAGQLKPNARHIQSLIRAIPDDQLLIETDAPDFLPAAAYRTFELPSPDLNHPANLLAGYQAVATIRDVSLDALRNQVEKNFETYFLS
jgi:TatD DNase family protein